MARKNMKTRLSVNEDSEHYSLSDDETRTVYLMGDIDEESVKSVTEKVITLSERNIKAPIQLVINTLGGEIDEALMLYDLMKFIRTPIHTVGLGKVMSAGCLLLAAVFKGKRRMGKNARLMYHMGWYSACGTIFEIENVLNESKKQETQYDRLFAFETGMNIEDVERLYNKNGPTVDRYLSADECLSRGVIDALI